MRILLDKILQSGIKLCLLTGVAFTFAACYGTKTDRWREQEPEFQADQQSLDQQLHSAAVSVHSSATSMQSSATSMHSSATSMHSVPASIERSNPAD